RTRSFGPAPSEPTPAMAISPILPPSPKPVARGLAWLNRYSQTVCARHHARLALPLGAVRVKLACMAKPFAKIITRRGFRRLAVIAAVGFVGLNVLAFTHARSLTHFVESGRRPLRPEEMSVGDRLEAMLLGISIPKPRNTTSPAEHGLAFDVLRFSTSSGLECEAWHVGCSGAKGTCILFHGYASCKHELLDAAEAWHGLGYDALLVDFRGCGGSTGSETTIGYHEADDVKAAFDYVRWRWPELPPILYGRSMGSAAILRALAVHRVEPFAVVLECPLTAFIRPSPTAADWSAFRPFRSRSS
ncbi:MAG TPA: alpha/beta fold hydrolase, partial [Pirellulales bacterium]|nr:alpha/beta fold hydrolase [Pirellulales bacterium]